MVQCAEPKASPASCQLPARTLRVVLDTLTTAIPDTLIAAVVIGAVIMLAVILWDEFKR